MDICYRVNNCALPGKDDLSLSLYFLVTNSSLYKNSLSKDHEPKKVVTEVKSEQKITTAVSLPWNLNAGP